MTDFVRVYRNLTKDVFSVQTKTAQGFRVKKHVKDFLISECVPVIHEKTRLRGLAQKKKYVHAFLTGIEASKDEYDLSDDLQGIIYNVEAGKFYYLNGDVYRGSPILVIKNRRVFAPSPLT